MHEEHVVLLAEDGSAIGTAPKATVHHADTPLHLAFSCYVFDAAGNLLISQRALSKRTFPGLWTNSLCGHPAAGEELATAVARRAETELGMALSGLRLVLPDFAYRAEMAGVVEWELCPVLTAQVVGAVSPNRAEVENIEWVPWPHFAAEVLAGDRAVSPWCRLQVAALVALGPNPAQWPEGDAEALPPALRAPFA